LTSLRIPGIFKLLRFLNFFHFTAEWLRSEHLLSIKELLLFKQNKPCSEQQAAAKAATVSQHRKRPQKPRSIKM
jgi:hypothetical protein